MDDAPYTCKYCGTEILWEKSDENRGEIWCCEKCGEPFCAQCAIDRIGKQAYLDMMQMKKGDELILCPDCYAKNAKAEG